MDKSLITPKVVNAEVCFSFVDAFTESAIIGIINKNKFVTVYSQGLYKSSRKNRIYNIYKCITCYNGYQYYTTTCLNCEFKSALEHFKIFNKNKCKGLNL